MDEAILQNLRGVQTQIGHLAGGLLGAGFGLVIELNRKSSDRLRMHLRDFGSLSDRVAELQKDLDKKSSTPIGVLSLNQMLSFSASTIYKKGDIVLYQPPLTQREGLYQAKLDVPAGTLPTNTAYWEELIAPGPEVLLESDVTSPAIAQIGAPAATITGMLATAGTALAAVTIPSGRRYRISVGEVRPTALGTSAATDHVVGVYPTVAETLAPDGSISLVLTPRWEVIAVAAATVVVAVAVNFYTARIRVELQ